MSDFKFWLHHILPILSISDHLDILERYSALEKIKIPSGVILEAILGILGDSVVVDLEPGLRG